MAGKCTRYETKEASKCECSSFMDRNVVELPAWPR